MKKTLIAMNIVFLLLTGVTVLSGNYMVLPLALTYAMAVGSIYGGQKKSFHYVTIVFNALYLVGGVWLFVMILLGKTALKEMGEIAFLSLFVLFALVLIPLLNVVFIKVVKLGAMRHLGEEAQ